MIDHSQKQERRAGQSAVVAYDNDDDDLCAGPRSSGSVAGVSPAGVTGSTTDDITARSLKRFGTVLQLYFLEQVAKE